MPKMTEDELRVAVDQQVRNALGYQSSKLSEQRRKALAFYLAKPVGELSPPEVEGRSRVVATDVADTVEAMLPQLLKTFVAGDNVVEFMAQKPDDEDKAKQATEYCNYVFYKQNPGFQIMSTWFKDALIQKNGICKIWWEEDESVKREEYEGLTDIQMTMLLTDPAHETKEVIEHTAYVDPVAQQQQQQAVQQLQQQLQQIQQQIQQAGQQNPQAAQQLMQQGQQVQAQLQQVSQQPLPQLHDIVLKSGEKTGKVCIENVPPEEFLIDRQAKSIGTARFLGHRLLRTLSDLKAAGYKNVDEITSDESGIYSSERIERVSIDDDMAWQFGTQESPADKAMRQVWLTECYVKVDYDGDGIAEWRKVTLAGNTLLDNEEADGHPFVSITPVPIPHRFFGTCPAEQAMETQRTSTSLWRAALDNLYLGVNGRYFAVQGQVNLDDLLTVRPGGVVRVQSPNAVGRLDTGMGDMKSAMSMIEYVETVKENRTGFTRYSQGNNADALNHTASGINIITNRSDQRQELIARTFAETGVKDMFKRILHLVCTYQDKPATVRLTSGWVDIDPREWKDEFDVSISVGLGTGNKDQQVQHLMAMLATQEKVFQLGVANPENVFNACKKLAANMGFKEAEQFFTDPSKAQPQPPKPDPAMVKVQTEQQLAAAKLQGEQQISQQKYEHDRQLELLKIEAENQRAQHQYILDRQRLEFDQQLAREKLEADIALRREEMIYKYRAQQESALYQQLNAESEAMVDEHGEQPTGPDDQGAAGGGAYEQPAADGSVPDAGSPADSGMGEQPDAGY